MGPDLVQRLLDLGRGHVGMAHPVVECAQRLDSTFLPPRPAPAISRNW